MVWGSLEAVLGWSWGGLGVVMEQSCDDHSARNVMLLTQR